MEINGAIRDALKQRRDEVTRRISADALRRALADCPSRSGATTTSNPQFDYQRCGGNERHTKNQHPSPFVPTHGSPRLPRRYPGQSGNEPA